MNFLRMILKPKVSCAFSMFALSTSCGQTDYVSTGPARRKDSNSENAGVVLDSRRQAANELLNSIYRLQQPIVGLAHIKNNEIPVILPISVHNDDVVFQIFRCNSNSSVQGAVEEFDSEHPSLSQPETAKEYFDRNTFWKDIERRCVAVSKAHPQAELLDTAAPSGNWRWFIRPCLPEKDGGEFNCSSVIAASMPMNGYRNSFSEYQQELLKKINLKIQSISSISATFPEKSRNLIIELEKCGVDDWNKASRSLLKSIALNLAGLGSSIVFEIFGPKADPGKSWSEKLNVIWQPPQDVQSNGQAVTRILLWLFTNQHDFKDVCSPAEEIRISASADTLKVKSLQIELSSDLDEADRLGLPLPSELKR